MWWRVCFLFFCSCVRERAWCMCVCARARVCDVLDIWGGDDNDDDATMTPATTVTPRQHCFAPHQHCFAPRQRCFAHDAVCVSLRGWAGGRGAVIPGGVWNVASGEGTLAVGSYAKATHASSAVLGFSGTDCYSAKASSLSLCAPAGLCVVVVVVEWYSLW